MRHSFVYKKVFKHYVSISHLSFYCFLEWCSSTKHETVKDFFPFISILMHHAISHFLWAEGMLIPQKHSMLPFYHVSRLFYSFCGILAGEKMFLKVVLKTPRINHPVKLAICIYRLFRFPFRLPLHRHSTVALQLTDCSHVSNFKRIL